VLSLPTVEQANDPGQHRRLPLATGLSTKKASSALMTRPGWAAGRLRR
jgi:hypothetical protein